MGIMGRPPKPLALRALHGHTSHGTPRNLPATDGVAELGPMPDWFSERQTEEWHYALKHAPYGVLTGSDRQTVIAWCVCVADFEEVARAGASPARTERLIKLSAQVSRLGNLLGFTPSSRATLSRAKAAGNLTPLTNGEAADGVLERYLRADPTKDKGEAH
jgi:phage terminase small subunit